MASGTEANVSVSSMRFPLPRVIIAIVMFTTGAAGLVFEYVLSTVTTYILGNAIEQFSMTIAVMMLFMGVAGALQKSIPDRHVFAAFVGAECLLALSGGFGPLLLEAAFAHLTTHFLLVHYTLAAVVGLLIGIEIPLIMRINARWSESLRANVGSVLTWDYAGAFAGALIWTFVLLRLFPITEIALVVAISNFVVALAATLAFTWLGFIRRPGMLVAAMGFTLAALVAGAMNAQAIDIKLEQSLYRAPIVLSTTTRYQHLVLTHDRQGDDWRLFINGNLQFSSRDEDRYHEMLVHPVMGVAERRNRVLILGGGDGLALRRVLDWEGVQDVLLVDLDPEMIRLAREHPALAALNHGALADARVVSTGSPGVAEGNMHRVRKGPKTPSSAPRANVAVMNVDADTFLRGADEGSWDVVIIDLPDPSSIELSKLYSQEFYQKVARVLAPGGAVSVQSTSPYHAREAFLTIGRTIRASGLLTLPYRVNVPSFGDWGFTLAWKDRPESEIRDRFIKGAAIATATFITPEVAQASLAFGRSELESRFSDANTLMRPVLLDRYTRQAWAGD